MKENAIITIDETSGVSLTGLDFIGIIDRGNNVLEIKPITLCNLHCRYCFVSAGDYDQNFIAEERYLVKSIRKVLEAKQSTDYEIHIAPYGEFFLYPQWEEFLYHIREIPEVKTVSIQTNGLLLTPAKVDACAKAGVTRLNISLNSLDAKECAEFCGTQTFPVDHLLKIMELVLESPMDLLISPIWFMGENDRAILDLIKFVKAKEAQGISWPKLRLGILNYVAFRTGRKIKRIHPEDFRAFYKRIFEYEKQFNLKLKLWAPDFSMHAATPYSPKFKMGDEVTVKILLPGRWKNEYIGRVDDQWAIKILTNKPLQIGTMIDVQIIKNATTGSVLTGEIIHE